MAIYIENIVRGFSRYHKYTLGTDLRNLSREIVSLIIRANSESDRLKTLYELRDKIEEFKVTLRICKEAKAFKNFNSFKHAIEEAISLSRQNEGWIKNMRGKK